MRGSANAAITAAVSSVEASSTTMTSKSTSLCRSTLRSVIASRELRLRVGTMTDTAIGFSSAGAPVIIIAGTSLTVQPSDRRVEEIAGRRPDAPLVKADLDSRAELFPRRFLEVHLQRRAECPRSWFVLSNPPHKRTAHVRRAVKGGGGGRRRLDFEISENRRVCAHSTPG